MGAGTRDNPALMGHRDRGVLVACGVLAFIVPPLDHTLSGVAAVILLVLPLWIIRRTVGEHRPYGPPEHAPQTV